MDFAGGRGGVHPARAAVPAVTISTFPTGEGMTALALSSTGQLVGWGADTKSQLGQGRTLRAATALQVGSGYHSVSVGESYLAAVKVDGSLWAWGDNTYSQLGDGSNSKFSALTQVGTGYAEVATGGYHVLALKRYGTLEAWGPNISGELGVASSYVDWAEDQFPASLLPRRPATQTLSHYRYRNYTAQNLFVAYSAGIAHLYFLAAPAPVVDLWLAAGWSRQAGCRPPNP